MTGCWTVRMKPSTMTGRTCSGGWSSEALGFGDDAQERPHLLDHGFEQGLLCP